MYGETFARAYDALMADVDYDAWAAYLLEMAARAGVAVRRAADCACGTGALTLRLARRGIDVTGIDLSEDMLRVAGDKARGAGLRVPYVRQDMRRFALHRPVDAVFCACDGINYLTGEGDPERFFRAAYAALRPGGGLFFDVSTPEKLAHTLGDNCFCSDGEAVAYLWQNHYSPRARTVQMDLSFFVRGADGRYERFDETHVQRAHDAEDLENALRAAGFARVTRYGDRAFAPPAEHEQRWHFAAIREG